MLKENETQARRGKRCTVRQCTASSETLSATLLLLLAVPPPSASLFTPKPIPQSPHQPPRPSQMDFNPPSSALPKTSIRPPPLPLPNQLYDPPINNHLQSYPFNQTNEDHNSDHSDDDEFLLAGSGKGLMVHGQEEEEKGFLLDDKREGSWGLAGLGIGLGKELEGRGDGEGVKEGGVRKNRLFWAVFLVLVLLVLSGTAIHYALTVKTVALRRHQINSTATGSKTRSGKTSSGLSGSSTATSKTSISTSTGKSAVPSPLFVIYTGGMPIQTLPGATDLDGFNVLILAFWTIAGGGAINAAATWTAMDNTTRASTKAAYAAAGVKVLVSLFGSTDTPTTSGVDPVVTADSVAAFVIQYDLDGADVDYEDLQAMNAGTGAEQWLISFTTELRKKLPSPYIISHAPLAPWFTTASTYPKGGYLEVNKQVGSLIDFYNIQFYNQVGEYTTCTTLITTSAIYPGTALLQIVASGIDPKKALLGKPADATDAHAEDYMPASNLVTCVDTAKSKGWSGGLMLWQWPDQEQGFVSTVWGK